MQEIIDVCDDGLDKNHFTILEVHELLKKIQQIAIKEMDLLAEKEDDES